MSIGSNTGKLHVEMMRNQKFENAIRNAKNLHQKTFIEKCNTKKESKSIKKCEKDKFISLCVGSSHWSYTHCGGINNRKLLNLSI